MQGRRCGRRLGRIAGGRPAAPRRRPRSTARSRLRPPTGTGPGCSRALPFRLAGSHLPLPGQSANSRTAGPRSALRVGALFEHGPTGNHFCTASVVSSPGKNLLITAAHCINGGKGSSGYDSDIVFIPDYRDGQEPFGVWTPAKLIVAPQWASSSDPDFDVGFVVLEAHHGKNIQQVLGASRLGTDQGYQYLVHVTGYPNSENVPITCVNWTSRFSDTQLKFECAGYTGGTSGSPWVTRFIAGSHTGTIVGVIGGYQEGGDTPSLSYSVRFGPGHPRPLPAGGHGRGRRRPADRLRLLTAARAGVR